MCLPHTVRAWLRLFFVSLTIVLTTAAQQDGGLAAKVAAHLRKAVEDLKANDANSASDELKMVLALDPGNAEAYANLGVIAFAHREYERAAQYLGQALAIQPSLVKTQALLGICDRRLGRSSAQPLLEKSFPLLQDKNLKVQTGLELANLDYRQGDLDGAVSVMRLLVEAAPDNIEVLYLAQRVYSELADGTRNKLAILAPGSSRMQQVIAERLINEGDLKRATDHYRKALELNPRLPGVHYELAEAMLESAPADPQNQASAEKELETAIAIDGDSAGVECMFGGIALRRADLDGAYAHYQRAVGLDAGDGQAQRGLGRTLAMKQQPEQAVKYLRMAVESDPLNEEAHYLLATVCKKLQFTSESEKEFRLFRELKERKTQLMDLYQQMNIRPPGLRSDGTEETTHNTPDR